MAHFRHGRRLCSWGVILSLLAGLTVPARNVQALAKVETLAQTGGPALKTEPNPFLRCL